MIHFMTQAHGRTWHAMGCVLAHLEESENVIVKDTGLLMSYTRILVTPVNVPNPCNFLPVCKMGAVMVPSLEEHCEGECIMLITINESIYMNSGQ